MPILALDLATTIGWALAEEPYRHAPTPVELAAGAKPPLHRSGVKSLIHCAGDVGKACAQFERWLQEMCMTFNPDLVVFEAPFVHGVKNANTARLLFGLCAMTEVVCYRRGLRVLECNNSTVKKHSGGGRPTKREILLRARERGWDPADHNAADALFLVDYAATLWAAPNHIKEERWL